MKKLVIAGLMLSMTLVSACNEETVKQQTVTNVSGCQNVRGVVDPTEGKIFYEQGHKLYSYVKLDPKTGDRNFCSQQEARNAGFSPAPRYFSNSTANLLKCLEGESEGGQCHSYVMGIYQSLAIYDKVCAGRDISHSRLRGAINSHTRSKPHLLEVDRYEGTASSFINEFSCSTVARKG